MGSQTKRIKKCMYLNKKLLVRVISQYLSTQLLGQSSPPNVVRSRMSLGPFSLRGRLVVVMGAAFH
jgi:hypothetical protein